MTNNFYDKVAHKFGQYRTEASYITECPGENPETAFKNKLLELSGKNKVALDLGCADGRFTLSISQFFKKIIAIDLSTGMLQAAKRLQKEKAVKNVSFEKQDAFHLNYPDKSFDLIYSRRGPTPFSEAFRLLQSGGHFLEIDIGEQDCKEIKLVFGRGQGFGKWNFPRTKKIKHQAQQAGLKLIFIKNYLYTEYYPSYQDLDLFLQGVPIFEDFDSQTDQKLLQQYVAQAQTKKGIKLPRHRIVALFQKP